jgi:hypothetical protein
VGADPSASSASASPTVLAETSCVRIFGTLLTSPLFAPLHELGDELVKLRRAQDAHRDRARQHGLLVSVLCGVVAGYEPGRTR